MAITAIRRERDNSAAIAALNSLRMFDTLVQACKTPDPAKRTSIMVEGGISIGQSLLNTPENVPKPFYSSRSLEILNEVFISMRLDEIRTIMGIVRPLTMLYFCRFEHTGRLEDLNISILIR